VDAIMNGDIAMVFNTTFGMQSIADSYSIRRSALIYSVAYFTTVTGMDAAIDGIMAMQRESLDAVALQEYSF
jgi:carbamoyl-phosphate synthase large subunit